ncbi:MAG: hypothetical protein ISN29_02540 [Gammaproteobacteria bacterium AqS3]|nr:hypothetical protein [Gammaproteobacteria bacterium AqS3]
MAAMTLIFALMVCAGVAFFVLGMFSDRAGRETESFLLTTFAALLFFTGLAGWFLLVLVWLAS